MFSPDKHKAKEEINANIEELRISKYNVDFQCVTLLFPFHERKNYVKSKKEKKKANVNKGVFLARFAMRQQYLNGGDLSGGKSRGLKHKQ